MQFLTIMQISFDGKMTNPQKHLREKKRIMQSVWDKQHDEQQKKNLKKSKSMSAMCLPFGY